MLRSIRHAARAITPCVVATCLAVIAALAGCGSDTAAAPPVDKALCRDFVKWEDSIRDTGKAIDAVYEIGSKLHLEYSNNDPNLTVAENAAPADAARTAAITACRQTPEMRLADILVAYDRGEP